MVQIPLERINAIAYTAPHLMDQLDSVALIRDCNAVQIPHGTATVLPKNTLVEIAQTLGGTFTVHAPGGLFRIAAHDADALGKQPASAQAEVGSATGPGQVTEEQIWNILKSCYDPEIPVNIVDLGLVYDLALEKRPSGCSAISVKMTLTTPGCGMGAVIARDAQERILMLEGVEEAKVEIVWDPPWHPSMITPEGRHILGLD
jgi:probable FeS assembly SUF system protein SufT